MATRLWGVLFAATVIVCGTSASVQVAVLPLTDANDPVRLSDGAFDAAEPTRPAITVRLENTTAQPLSTDRIWLSLSRFYTPEETRRNGDRIIWNCGLMARANHDQPTQIIPPGTSVPGRLEMRPACNLNPQHEHFFVVVQRITAGQSFVGATWRRTPADHTRLLQAAMLIAR